LEESIERKKEELLKRQQQLESHKKFSDFLEKVVQLPALSEIIQASNKGGDSGKNEKDTSINWLRERFINLKRENKKLKERKAEIAHEMEQVREREKQEMELLTESMYKKSKEMQEIQEKIEKLNDTNSKLDAEFENQVTEQNKSKQEAHQIVYSIENIYEISRDLYKYRGIPKKFKELEPDERLENMILKIEKGEEDALKKHVSGIIKMLDQAQSTVHDLITVKQYL